MSVVAVKDGMMATDSFANYNGIQCNHKKLHCLEKDGRKILVGYVGNLLDCQEFLRWFENDADLDKLPNFRPYKGSDDSPFFTALVLTKEKLVEWDQYFLPLEIIDRPYAVGSGAQAALGAMYMGASAMEAVEIACKICVNVGGQILQERL